MNNGNENNFSDTVLISAPNNIVEVPVQTFFRGFPGLGTIITLLPFAPLLQMRRDSAPSLLKISLPEVLYCHSMSRSLYATHRLLKTNCYRLFSIYDLSISLII